MLNGNFYPCVKIATKIGDFSFIFVDADFTKRSIYRTNVGNNSLQSTQCLVERMSLIKTSSYSRWKFRDELEQFFEIPSTCVLEVPRAFHSNFQII